MSDLGLLDQAMFKLEVAGMSPMYMCGAFILEAANSPYPLNPGIIADHLAACMEEVPLMRKRLVQDPLKLGNLRLVDDADFKVRNHISCTVLDPPGGYDELMEALGEFSGRRMDLSRPLWHFEIVDGLADDQIAVVAHIHHAIMDGMEGMRIVEAMLSDRPVPGRKPRKQAWRPTAVPTPVSLLGGAVVENLRRLYIEAPMITWKNAGPILHSFSEQVSKRISAAVTPGKESGKDTVKVHKTSLNVAPISSRRTVACLELPLNEVSSLRRTFNCSINDLALLFNSFALEHYFAGIGEKIDFDIIAGMPMDVRTEGDASAGNALALARVNLRNTVAGIRKRLQAISDETALIKRTSRPAKTPVKARSGIDYKALSTLFSPLMLDAMIYGFVRFNLAEKATFFNLGISNLPGKQVPSYLAGAKIRSLIPLAPPADSLALTITVTSTDKHLIFTYHGCAETIRDKALFVEGARRAFRLLKRAARQGRKSTAAKTGAKKVKKSARQ